MRSDVGAGFCLAAVLRHPSGRADRLGLMAGRSANAERSIVSAVYSTTTTTNHRT